MNLSGLPYLFISILFSLSLILLPGCTNQEEETKAIVTEPVPIQGGIYRMPLPNNPATLDPAYVQDNYGEAIIHQVFDGLVRFDPYLSVLPALAETWQVKQGGREYRFVLRENARFHNLESVTSADVVFSIKIGRASCRERVYAIVLISVVAVSLKKKKKSRV